MLMQIPLAAAAVLLTALHSDCHRGKQARSTRKHNRPQYQDLVDNLISRQFGDVPDEFPYSDEDLKEFTSAADFRQYLANQVDVPNPVEQSSYESEGSTGDDDVDSSRSRSRSRSGSRRSLRTSSKSRRRLATQQGNTELHIMGHNDNIHTPPHPTHRWQCEDTDGSTGQSMMSAGDVLGMDLDHGRHAEPKEADGLESLLSIAYKVVDDAYRDESSGVDDEVDALPRRHRKSSFDEPLLTRYSYYPDGYEGGDAFSDIETQAMAMAADLKNKQLRRAASDAAASGSVLKRTASSFSQGPRRVIKKKDKTHLLGEYEFFFGIGGLGVGHEKTPAGGRVTYATADIKTPVKNVLKLKVGTDQISGTSHISFPTVRPAPNSNKLSAYHVKMGCELGYKTTKLFLRVMKSQYNKRGVHLTVVIDNKSKKRKSMVVTQVSNNLVKLIRWERQDESENGARWIASEPTYRNVILWKVGVTLKLGKPSTAKYIAKVQEAVAFPNLADDHQNKKPFNMTVLHALKWIPHRIEV